MTAVHVRCQQVQLAYQGRLVLQKLSFEVPAGQSLALLGAPGAGKTHLLRILAGLQQPDAGQVWFNTTNVTRVPAQARRVGLLRADDALWPHLTLWRQLALPLLGSLLGRSERRERIGHWLERLELSAVSRARPAQLTPYERQRAALARILVTEPQVLLCDAPWANLDPDSAQSWRHTLQTLQRELGITMVLSTSQPHDALAQDQIGLLHDGTLLQIGAPGPLYDAPATARAARFFGTLNTLPARVLSRTDERLVLAVDGLHDLVLPVEADTPASDLVLVGFRPHAVHIVAGSSRGESRFQWEPGVVVRSELQGAHIRYHVVVGPHLVVVDQPHYRGEDWIAPNTVVMIGLEVGQMRLLPE